MGPTLRKTIALLLILAYFRTPILKLTLTIKYYLGV